MAAAANQNLQNQLDQTTVTARDPLSAPSTYLISGVPSLEWHKTKKVLDDLLSKKRVGGTLDAKSVAQGTAPGNPHAGGPAPAAGVIATFTTASLQTYGELKLMIPPSTSLHSTLETAPYMNDAVLSYALINHFMQLNPSPEDIAAYNTEFDSKSFANSVQLTSTSVFNWKDHLVNFNESKPPIMRKTNNEVVRKFCHFIHPKLAGKAMDMYDNNPVALQYPAVYPANIVPGGPAHPNAGVAHPLAGQRNIDAYVLILNTRYLKLIETGDIVLPGPIHVNHLFDDAPLGTGIGRDDDVYLTVSVYELLEYGYSVEQVRAINRRSKFPRCFGCGGVNHFAKKDGKYICLTPEGSVPSHVLFGIKYPVEVIQPPIGKGRGKGKGGYKGKGKGKGSPYSSRGRGRGDGAHAASEYDHIANLLREDQHEMDDTDPPPLDAPPSDNVGAGSGDVGTGTDAMDNGPLDADGFSVEDLYSTIVVGDDDVNGVGVH